MNTRIFLYNILEADLVLFLTSVEEECILTFRIGALTPQLVIVLQNVA